MALMTWSAGFAIGVKEIDDQHMRLVDLVNALHEGMINGRGDSVGGRILDDLVSYTVMHFETEERLMLQYGYPDSAAHQAEHAALVARVQEKIAEAQAHKMGLSMGLMIFLKDWLQTHILGSDKKLATFLNTKGVH